MSTTSIKVDRSVRDRLASVAHSRGTTMGALLSEVTRRLETEQRWAEIEAAYARLQQEDPEAWRAYLSELAEWDAASVEEEPQVAEEWPEYNA